jgi:hypothetical protein
MASLLPSEIRRFCRECCADESNAVTLDGVLNLPVAEVRIRKMWA